MMSIDAVLQLVVNAIFQGIGAGIGVGIGTYMIQRSLIKHLEKFEEGMKKRRTRRG